MWLVVTILDSMILECSSLNKDLVETHLFKDKPILLSLMYGSGKSQLPYLSGPTTPLPPSTTAFKLTHILCVIHIGVTLTKLVCTTPHASFPEHAFSHFPVCPTRPSGRPSTGLPATLPNTCSTVVLSRRPPQFMLPQRVYLTSRKDIRFL